MSSKVTASLKAMYSVVKACIRYNGVVSDSIESTIGLKQGDPSSSLLFMFYINDLLDNINTDIDDIFTINELKIFLILYADDAVVFSTSPMGLQSILNDITNYCEAWGLKVNTAKTKIAIFERGRQTNVKFTMANEILEIVTSFKYLGTTFHKNGNWYRTQKELAQHASYSMHKLFCTFSQIDLSISDKCKLFDTLVTPVLNYGSQVWGMHEAKDIKIVHNKFCRRLLCVK